MTGLCGALLIAGALVAGAVLWGHQPVPFVPPGQPAPTTTVAR